MALRNYSNKPIANIHNTVEKKLAPYANDEHDDVQTSKQFEFEQEKELTRKKLSIGLFALLIFGYVLTAGCLIATGLDIGFSLESYVLAVLVASSMGSGAFMFNKITSIIFN